MATNTYDQFSKTASNNNNGLTSVATQRTSINSLLNPEPDVQQKSFNTTSTSYSTQSNDDWYDHQSLENQQGQNWRRYSSPNLSPESSSTSNSNNKNGLTINYCDDTSSSQQSSQIDSSISQSMPTSPVFKHSSPMSDYNGTNNIDDKVSSSSAPSSRRSSMNRSSGSGQAVNSSSNGNSNMITPPQTPGIKSPTKANFSFPPNVTSCEQIMPQKVKRKRITQEQLQDLVAMFEQTDTPSYDVREKLAKKLNMTNREVQVYNPFYYHFFFSAFFFRHFILIFFFYNRYGSKTDALKQIEQRQMNIARPINITDFYIIIQYQQHKLPVDMLHQLICYHMGILHSFPCSLTEVHQQVVLLGVVVIVDILMYHLLQITIKRRCLKKLHLRDLELLL